MPSAFVTGANGHIGNHVVRELLSSGWTVRALVRERSDRRALVGLNVEACVGDVLDVESLAKAAAGCEYMFHVAAAHKNFATDRSEITRPAIEGTRNALDAAAKAGVRRVVYTSSGATVGLADDPSRRLDESHFASGVSNPYSIAKIEAERIAMDRAKASSSPEIVVLNPSGVFGPRDYRITPATMGLVGLAQGDPSMLTVSVTDVRDVARAHRLAAEKGRHGERYIIAGEVCSPDRVADIMARISGRKPRVMTPPRFLLNMIARVQVWKARRNGTDAPITRELLDDAYGHHLSYDNGKSKRELGMTYVDAEQVLRDAYRWLLFVGALKPSAAARIRETLGTAAEPDADWA